MESALRSLGGVRRVEVNFEGATVLVEHDPALASDREVHAAIRAASYGVIGEDHFQTIHKRGGGGVWVQAFVDHVDLERCTGCGRCVQACGQNVYALREIAGERRAIVVNGDECLGDCHCHKTCRAGAIVCRPRRLTLPDTDQEKVS